MRPPVVDHKVRYIDIPMTPTQVQIVRLLLTQGISVGDQVHPHQMEIGDLLNALCMIDDLPPLKMAFPDGQAIMP